jgi:hypothetical protein
MEHGVRLRFLGTGVSFRVEEVAVFALVAVPLGAWRQASLSPRAPAEQTSAY